MGVFRGAFRGCTCLKCTNVALLVHFLLYWCTSCSVGALETSAPPKAPPNDSFCKGTANRRLHKTKATKKALPTEGNALIFIYISYSVAL